MQTIMTARQLLSILRLSQSLARIRFLEGVTSEEVDEVIFLFPERVEVALEETPVESYVSFVEAVCCASQKQRVSRVGSFVGRRLSS